MHRFLLGDYHPYIYRTDDYGESWTLLTDGSNGIPADWPTRVVREDPDREGLLYAGTELGLFISFFWLYNIIDAGRRATLYNQVLAGNESIEPPSDFKMPRFGGSVFGGLILIGVSFVLLLNTRWGVSLEWIEGHRGLPVGQGGPDYE